VRLAHHFALENSLIQADCVEATEFPDLAGRYRVFAVPKIVINEKASFEGALPEEFFVDEVLKAVAPSGKPGEVHP
jgi:thioredoxin family protein